MKNEVVLNEQIKEIFEEMENKKDDINFCYEWLTRINETYSKDVEKYKNGEIKEEAYKLYEISFLIEAKNITRKLNLYKNMIEILEVEIDIISNTMMHNENNISELQYKNRKVVLTKRKEEYTNRANNQFQEETNKLIELQIQKLTEEENQGKITRGERLEKETKIVSKLTSEIEKEKLLTKKPEQKNVKALIPSVNNHSSR